MKKNIHLILIIIIATLVACAPRETLPPTAQPAAVTVIPAATETASTTPTTEETPSSSWLQYSNTDYGLGFQYPVDWYGPEEYIAEPILRVEIGSDLVYPYGTDPTERVYNQVNSYSIVIQYSQNEQTNAWTETYQALESLQDGESFSDARVTITRARQLTLGNFTGYEYTTAPSETAQTERFFSREVILVDDQSHVLTIFGTPNNVEINDGADWRSIYQEIDAANLEIFHQIVESITFE
ncbi:MAG: hypothetical protein HPY85_11485 [Anaerolineae bacterium]|nr:hypothetical protein [Anaerolineae bacterium]